MKIIMASDHAGVALKLEIKALLTELEFQQNMFLLKLQNLWLLEMNR